MNKQNQHQQTQNTRPGTASILLADDEPIIRDFSRITGTDAAELITLALHAKRRDRAIEIAIGFADAKKKGAANV